MAIEWAGAYHECRSRHSYLKGWVEGQASVTPPEPEPVKRPLLSRLGF